MFNTLGLLTVSLTVLATFFITVIVFIRNPRSASHILLSLMAILLIAWAATNYLALSPGSEETRLFWVRIVMFVTTPLAPLIFLLASVFPEANFNIKKSLFLVILFSTLFTAAIALSPYTFTKLVNLPDGSFRLYPGWGIIAYAINLMVLLSWGLAKLVQKYKKSNGLLRKQLGIFVYSIVISFSLMTLTNFIAVVVFKTISLTMLGPTFTLLIVAGISYAIIRHGLLDIKILATELFVVFLLLILFAKIVIFTSIGELIVDVVIFVSVLFFGILLIRSVIREVMQREKLQVLTERLKAVDKQKDEFVSMAAHELRAPMTAIKGYLSMVVEGDAGDIPEKARGFLADTAAINERLIRLVNNMLNVSRIEEGRMVYQIEQENLSSVVRAAFAQFRSETERKGLKFELIIPPEIKDRIEVDMDRIHEVVANLLSNAIKYTEKGKITVRLSQPNPGNVRFEVEDTGPGISKEEQGKLFQKFVRAESSIGKTTGTGLGLYICRLLIEEFYGRIGLISEEKKGSIFWFEIPLVNKKVTA